MLFFKIKPEQRFSMICRSIADYTFILLCIWKNKKPLTMYVNNLHSKNEYKLRQIIYYRFYHIYIYRCFTICIKYSYIQKKDENIRYLHNMPQSTEAICSSHANPHIIFDRIEQNVVYCIINSYICIYYI